MALTDLKDLYPTFQRLARAKDIDGLLDLYEPSASIVASPGRTVAGTDAIRATLAALLGAGEDPTLTERYIYDTGDGLALASCAWSVGPLAGTTAEILRRQSDGTWKYVLDNPFA